jgi:MYXO-CTERM domain-containing protein
MCVGICDGVTCPHAQICRAGRCVNPCEGVTCNPMEVCDQGPGPRAGLCVPGCQCTPCAEGQSCQPDGYCASDDCAGITCPTGMYCRGGQCRDSCEAGPDTRLCPSGETCQAGECVVSSSMPRDSGVGDAAADGSANPDAGRVDAGRTDGGVTRDIGASSDVDDTPIVLPPSSRGCQCSTTDQKVDTRWAALGLAFGAVVVARRRRR